MNSESKYIVERLLSLLEAVREDRASAAREELNRWLLADAAARTAMARLLVDEQALISCLRDERIVAMLGNEGTAALPETGQRARERSWSRRYWLPLAATALVAVFAGLAAWWLHERPMREVTAESAGLAQPPLAVVTQAIGAEWRGPAFQPDDRVPAGRLTLATGLVRLQFLSGATVVLQGPAGLDLKSEREAVVRSGLVTATVPPVAEGFTLVAGGWLAVDRGTVFGVDARSPEHATVRVLEGRVDLHRNASAPLERSLTAGESVQLSEKGGIEPAGATTVSFPREKDVIERAASAERGQIESWRQHKTTLAKDPSLVLYYDFENADRERGVIHNLAPGAEPFSEGTVIGGEWTQGRWPGKNAVAFQRAGDLIRTSLRTELDAATFITSLRVEPQSPPTQTILLSPRGGPGQIYWLLVGRDQPTRGSGSAFIKTDEGRKDHRFASGRPLLPRELGRWLTVTVVHDPANHRVRHYLNGKLIMENTLKDDTRLKLNQIVIGNWGFSTEPRNFAGRMDELAIFRRALSDTEIRAFQTSP